MTPTRSVPIDRIIGTPGPSAGGLSQFDAIKIEAIKTSLSGNPPKSLTDKDLKFLRQLSQRKTISQEIRDWASKLTETSSTATNGRLEAKQKGPVEEAVEITTSALEKETRQQKQATEHGAAASIVAKDEATAIREFELTLKENVGNEDDKKFLRATLLSLYRSATPEQRTAINLYFQNKATPQELLTKYGLSQQQIELAQSIRTRIGVHFTNKVHDSNLSAERKLALTKEIQAEAIKFGFYKGELVTVCATFIAEYNNTLEANKTANSAVVDLFMRTSLGVNSSLGVSSSNAPVTLATNKATSAAIEATQNIIRLLASVRREGEQIMDKFFKVLKEIRIADGIIQGKYIDAVKTALSELGRLAETRIKELQQLIKLTNSGPLKQALKDLEEKLKPLMELAHDINSGFPAILALSNITRVVSLFESASKGLEKLGSTLSAEQAKSLQQTIANSSPNPYQTITTRLLTDLQTATPQQQAMMLSTARELNQAERTLAQARTLAQSTLQMMTGTEKIRFFAALGDMGKKVEGLELVLTNLIKRYKDDQAIKVFLEKKLAEVRDVKQRIAEVRDNVAQAFAPDGQLKLLGRLFKFFEAMTDNTELIVGISDRINSIIISAREEDRSKLLAKINQAMESGNFDDIAKLASGNNSALAPADRNLLRGLQVLNDAVKQGNLGGIKEAMQKLGFSLEQVLKIFGDRISPELKNKLLIALGSEDKTNVAQSASSQSANTAA